MGAVSRISTRCDDDIDSNRWLTTWAVNTNSTQPRRQYFFICTQTGESARSHDVRLHRLYIHNRERVVDSEKRAVAVGLMVTSFTAIRAIKTLLWRRLCRCVYCVLAAADVMKTTNQSMIVVYRRCSCHLVNAVYYSSIADHPCPFYSRLCWQCARSTTTSSSP